MPAPWPGFRLPWGSGGLTPETRRPLLARSSGVVAALANRCSSRRREPDCHMQTGRGYAPLSC